MPKGSKAIFQAFVMAKKLKVWQKPIGPGVLGGLGVITIRMKKRQLAGL